ncbi:hypothetical protein [Streptomyces mexicanus]|uniref:hypothetical protein n=1 Tax=Streptomyces mexicanus TaxID=178566 RepID=UPI0036463D2A
MRSLSARRAGIAAAAAARALLATACGGSSDAGGKDDDGFTVRADRTAPAPAAATPPTAAELEKAALTQADVTSGKAITEVPAGDNLTPDKVTSAVTACTPLALLQAGTYPGTPAGTAKRSWVSDGRKVPAGAGPEESADAAMDRTKTVETLASYRDGGAEQVMKDLKTAVRECAGGFSCTAAGTRTKVLKVVTATAPQGADEAPAVTSTVAADGVDAPMKSVVVRKGATVVLFPAVTIASVATGRDFAFPAGIVDARLEKLK